jgi:hypothetical protein
MKPVVIIGPGTSLLNYTFRPTRQVVLTCPECGATAVASEAGGPVTIAHQPDCELLDSLERLASVNRREGTDDAIN